MDVTTVIGAILAWVIGAGCIVKKADGYLTWRGLLIALILIPFICYLAFSMMSFVFWFLGGLFENTN